MTAERNVKTLVGIQCKAGRVATTGSHPWLRLKVVPSNKQDNGSGEGVAGWESCLLSLTPVMLGRIVKHPPVRRWDTGLPTSGKLRAS